VSCCFGCVAVVSVMCFVHRSISRSAYGWQRIVCGLCESIGIRGTCAEYAKVAGHEIPKCVRRSGQRELEIDVSELDVPGLCVSITIELFVCFCVSASVETGFILTTASTKLTPLHHFTHSSATRKLLRDGQHSVMVCPSDCARAYPSPLDPV
jgi:hypothetical protein